MNTDAKPGLVNRRVILAGASGLVGSLLLKGLMADETVSEIHVLGRRQLPAQHAKMKMHVVDFTQLPTLPAADEVFLALGTTIKAAGSKEAFRAVDFDANLAVARAALQAGARRIGLVSAMGAKAGSLVFYNRTKGELEDAILELGVESVVIVRPSLLLGNRDALGQPRRSGERFAQAVMGILGSLLPPNMRPVQAEKVARALLQNSVNTSGTVLLSSREIQSY